MKNLLKIVYNKKNKFQDFEILHYRQNAPVVDGSFLAEKPRKLLQSGKFARIPMIIGYNSLEGLNKFIGHTEFPTHINFTHYVPNDLNPTGNTELGEKIAEEISNFYKSQDYNDDILQMEIDVATDSSFLHGVYTTLKARAAISKSLIYFYRFSVDSNLNIIKQHTPIAANKTGTAHTEDLFYLFHTYLTPTITPGSLEDQSIEKMVKLWTNFAKYGNPTPKTADGCVIGVEWPLATNDSIRYLKIENTFDLGMNPDSDRMEFWYKLYEKYYVE